MDTGHTWYVGRCLNKADVDLAQHKLHCQVGRTFHNKTLGATNYPNRHARSAALEVEP
jgi:hypothetical protein